MTLCYIKEYCDIVTLSWCRLVITPNDCKSMYETTFPPVMKISGLHSGALLCCTFKNVVQGLGLLHAWNIHIYFLGKGGYGNGSVGLFVSVYLFVCKYHYSKSYEQTVLKFCGGVVVVKETRVARSQP